MIDAAIRPTITTMGETSGLPPRRRRPRATSRLRLRPVRPEATRAALLALAGELRTAHPEIFAFAQATALPEPLRDIDAVPDPELRELIAEVEDILAAVHQSRSGTR